MVIIRHFDIYIQIHFSYFQSYETIHKEGLLFSDLLIPTSCYIYFYSSAHFKKSWPLPPPNCQRPLWANRYLLKYLPYFCCQPCIILFLYAQKKLIFLNWAINQRTTSYIIIHHFKALNSILCRLHTYCIYSYSFRGNYSFLNLIVCAMNFGHSTYRCGSYSREETIQGRKLYEEIR